MLCVLCGEKSLRWVVARGHIARRELWKYMIFVIDFVALSI
jgi:hypothetical protein